MTIDAVFARLCCRTVKPGIGHRLVLAARCPFRLIPEATILNRRTLAALILAMGGVSCASTTGRPAPPIVQPGAPGEPSRVVTAAQAADASRVGVTEADVLFMQGMIA